MSTFVETATKTFTAGAAIAQYSRVKLSGGKLAAAGASDVALGTLEEASFADGDVRAVRLRTAQGTIKMVAAGAITAGNPVYAAAAGRVDATGTVYCGTALESTTTAADVLEVLPGPNTDIAATLANTNAAAFEVDADATTPKLAIAGQAAGTGDYTTTMKPESTLSGDNTIIVPEADGDTLAAVALAQTLTNKTLTAPTIGGAVVISDAATVAVGTGTGLKFATSASQKLGFFNATPVVQPTNANQATAGAMTLTGANTGTSGTGLNLFDGTWNATSAAYLMDDLVALNEDITAIDTELQAIRTALVNLGLIKGS